MRFWIIIINAFVALAVNTATAFFNDLPPDGLSITPQDGHILFDDSIDHAQSSIDMIMFHLTDPEVVTHLLNAQKRGVQVRIILDHQAMNSPSSKAIFDQLNASGLQVRPSSALFSISHAKAAVFDNQWALITSMNLTRVFSFSRDYGIRTFDPSIVTEFEAVFAADWKNSVDQTKDTPALSASKLVWSPVNSKEKILAFINSAQSSLIVEVENLGDNDVINALKLKAQSGVKTIVIVPACVEGGGTRNIPLMNNLASSGVDARLSMPPYTPQNPYLHGKAIVVDQQNFYVGSENLSYNSLTQAREVGIMETNPQISAVILKAMSVDAKLASSSTQVAANFTCPDPNNGNNMPGSGSNSGSGSGSGSGSSSDSNPIFYRNTNRTRSK